MRDGLTTNVKDPIHIGIATITYGMTLGGRSKYASGGYSRKIISLIRPPPAPNETVEVSVHSSGKTYDPPANPNTKTAIFLDDSEDEAEEVEKEAEPLPKKPTQTDTPPLKAYKPKIPYPTLEQIKNRGYDMQVFRLDQRIDSIFKTDPTKAWRNPKILLSLNGSRMMTRVPLILGRPFLHIVDAIIRVKNKELNLGIGEDRVTFHIDKSYGSIHGNIGQMLLHGWNVQEDEVKRHFRGGYHQNDVNYVSGLVSKIQNDLGVVKPLPKHLEYAFLEEISSPSIIYAIEDSPWVSLVHCVPKKGGMTIVTNEDNEQVPHETANRMACCIEYRKCEEATRKDHFPLPFMDQMLERLAGNKLFCFLDGFSRYFSNSHRTSRSGKDDFHLPLWETYPNKRMPFGLLQRSTSNFSKELNSNFLGYARNLHGTHLVLNWEKCHFMVTEGIVLGHKVSCKGLEVDKAKINVIAKLPPPLTSKPLEILLLQEFDIEIKNKKGAENVATDHLSQLEKPNLKELKDEEINDEFPDEFLISIETDEEESS
ncbi:hypothetical protein Tco_1045767 [Tanacetum coccineum]|uniref:Reverse transcriptase domain-containing protein n=1 Tax=Tanacetum coccineum TaxID=301880 RepID=A0ABQ5GVW9_9ASTR